MTFVNRGTAPTDRKDQFLRFVGGATGASGGFTSVFFDVPEWATFMDVVLVGAGGGGGNGFTRTAGSAGGGGGGGGCGAFTRATFCLSKMPKRLLLQLGSAVNGASGAGAATSLCIPEAQISTAAAVASNIFLTSLSGSCGTSGTGAAVGTGGSGPSATSATSMLLLYTAATTFISLPGNAGSNGGAIAGAAGGAATLGLSGGNPITPGAGGAGCTTTDFNGGGINSGANVLMPAAITVGGIAPGGNGSCLVPKYALFYPGGSGGASNNSGQAGHGGNASPGCGGGGGGAGATGGIGGNGGPGYAEITFF